jgi:hypothetical protein
MIQYRVRIWEHDMWPMDEDSWVSNQKFLLNQYEQLLDPDAEGEIEVMIASDGGFALDDVPHTEWWEEDGEIEIWFQNDDASMMFQARLTEVAP